MKYKSNIFLNTLITKRNLFMFIAMIVCIGVYSTLSQYITSYQGNSIALLQSNTPFFIKKTVINYTFLSILSIAMYRISSYFKLLIYTSWRYNLTQKLISAFVHSKQFENPTVTNIDKRLTDDIYNFTSNVFTIIHAGLLSFILLMKYLPRFVRYTQQVGIVLIYALTAIIVISLSISILLQQFFHRSISQAWNKHAQVSAEQRENILTSHIYAVPISALHGHDFIEHKLIERSQQEIQATISVINSQNIFLFFSKIMDTFNTKIGYFVFIPMHYCGYNITISQAVELSGVMFYILNSLSFFTKKTLNIAKIKAYYIRLHDLYEHCNEQESQSLRTEYISSQAMIFEGNIDYKNGTPLLHKLHLIFNPGDRVLIHGKSGVGKTTLFKVLNNQHPYVHGTLQIPQNASTFFLPQQVYILDATIEENIIFPHNSNVNVSEILSAVLPNYKTLLIKNLSAGEKQKINIMRLLTLPTKPDFIFLDEPFSNLPSTEQIALMNIIAEHFPDSCITLIMHDGEYFMGENFFTQTIHLQSS